VRAGLLKRRHPEKAAEIDAAVERLTHESQMGTLFKAMTIFEGLDREEPPGFEAACGSAHS
jgi:SAM-dependent MidA family methyltransferase